MSHHNSISGMARPAYEARPYAYQGHMVEERAVDAGGIALQEMTCKEQAAYISYQNKTLQATHALRNPHSLPDLHRLARVDSAAGSQRDGAENAGNQ